MTVRMPQFPGGHQRSAELWFQAGCLAMRDAIGSRGLSEDGLFQLLAAWDEVSAAIDCIVVCQPAGMTAAAEMLEAQRKSMRGVINAVTRQSNGGA